MKKLQQQIIKELRVKPQIDPQAEIRRSIDFMKAYLKKHPFLKTLVLGISGGQDSTLTGKLSQLAITEMRQETKDDTYQFIAVRLPYGNQADEQDALDAIEYMQADKTVRVNIKPATDQMVASLLENKLEVSDFNKGNIKARQRMIAQYGVAGALHGAVVGTDHAAEAITGFYTKYGDGGADITPIWRLDKRQGKQLLKVLQAPEHLYLKTPTADLEEDRPALADEVALGVTYQNIDDYLEGKEIPEAAAKKIENWYLKTQHKRHLPINVYDEFWK
ncbi:MAG: ammonia-dependent NAD(+) synthetase [Liquorilactobacillus nagelii]|jgi:NAD+ synthase|uniref:NH(3)-dependent NAD(+) synthetase n=1 Tax=Liquorilactobacillus nagelii TaxID=82688 RepID=A0A3S6QTK7_9LACO|nr:ammonia-dependent NAD(+) synthetase [Liquorilactobacillus nagelii]AUJ31451.1 NAD(+) synthase [Liquorilactobacillus nagelii]MCC7617157.1 ammonia-dependent NAD(+) synthetase [Liquorilactobacillus nagelii]MCI1699750.1 ammonia-dependent NAD(+) synthetase [Liquorilactobacillus nagelii]MCP9316114.1 ammonia-dependent NAD(+) synthetase [Liquorilactobacillus nagelii]QYH54614.1 ammonia-dependent NAD(+) synthetase [Liquorilactobacillus nagelii DSM 13675]